MRKKVCIVGANQLTRHLVDWEQDADFWIMNEMAAFPWAKKCDGLFQLHHPKIWRNPLNTNYVYHYEWLQVAHGFPIWMQKKFGDIPASKKYPLNKICEALLPNLSRKSGKPVQYFTSTAAYCLALAIYLGYEEIEIVGVEMASNTEYVQQRDGVTFWIGIAIGRGIKVVIQDRSLLLRAHLYGYTGEVTLQRQRLEIVAKSLAPKVKEKEAETLEMGGQIQAILTSLAREKSQSRAQKLYDDLINAMNKQSQVVFEYGQITGQYALTMQFLAEVDALIKASGGEKALAVLAGEPVEIPVNNSEADLVPA